MIRAESSLHNLLRRWTVAARRPRLPFEKLDELLSFPAMYVDVVITATDVVKGAEFSKANGTAGGTITAGMPLYKDTADQRMKPADCNLSDLASTVEGISLHGATNGQPIEYQTSGLITLSAVLTLGKVYVASATAGGIAPVADLTTGWRTSILGVAVSTSSMRLAITNSLVTNA